MIASGASHHGATRGANVALTCVGVAILWPMAGLLCTCFQDGGVAKRGHYFKKLEILMIGFLASINKHQYRIYYVQGSILIYENE